MYILSPILLLAIIPTTRANKPKESQGLHNRTTMGKKRSERSAQLIELIKGIERYWTTTRTIEKTTNNTIACASTPNIATLSLCVETTNTPCTSA